MHEANGPKTRAREKRQKSKVQGPRAEASCTRQEQAKGYNNDGAHQRKVVKVLTWGTDHTQWHVGSVGGTVLKSERKMKGLCLGLFETCKRRREKGGTGEGSLASQRGQCRSIYASWTCKLRQNETEQNQVKQDMSNEIELSKVIWQHATR